MTESYPPPRPARPNLHAHVRTGYSYDGSPVSLMAFTPRCWQVVFRRFVPRAERARTGGRKWEFEPLSNAFWCERRALDWLDEECAKSERRREEREAYA